MGASQMDSTAAMPCTLSSDFHFVTDASVTGLRILDVRTVSGNAKTGTLVKIQHVGNKRKLQEATHVAQRLLWVCS